MSSALSTPTGLLENEPLAAHTTIGIGGPARWFLCADTIDALSRALLWARAEGLPVLVLGGGSNLLVSDAGFPGLVVKVSLRGISRQGDELTAAAGENWDGFVAFAVDQELAGIECLSGIPGFVGGSPIQNIGAYGQEVKDTIVRVEALDRKTGEPVTFSNGDCRFGYRTSRFKHGTDCDRYVVTAVTFRLVPGGKPTLRYGDLTRYFAERGISQPSLAEVRQAVLAVRRSKAMVWEPEVEPNSRSCGSFFTNPVVAAPAWDQALQRLKAAGAVGPEERIPVFEAGEGQVKLSAAWLMERSGLKKGLELGNVGLSTCHVLAVINRGGGQAAEVLRLVEHVQQSVFKATGIHLEPEPVFVGFQAGGQRLRSGLNG